MPSHVQPLTHDGGYESGLSKPRDAIRQQPGLAEGEERTQCKDRPATEGAGGRGPRLCCGASAYLGRHNPVVAKFGWNEDFGGGTGPVSHIDGPAVHPSLVPSELQKNKNINVSVTSLPTVHSFIREREE